MMTPVEYARQYTSLVVATGLNTTETVSVRAYQNTGTTHPQWTVKPVTATVWGTVQGKVVAYMADPKNKGLLHGRPIAATKNPAGWQLVAMLVHQGGGAPHEIATVLQIVHLYWKELRAGAKDL